jgi:pimeloyl-ACP methyl ester carboxylesterase
MRTHVGNDEIYAYTGSRPSEPGRPSVMFVHGAANDHSVFALQSRYFAYHGRNVYAVDLPGHGRSDGDALPSVEAIADWIGTFLDALKVKDAALVGHSLGSLAVLEAAARFSNRISKIALLGPAVPMAVSDDLMSAAQSNDHVAYELINGWSYSAARQLGGNPLPGVWMTGNAMRLLERTRANVLFTDLAACRDYAGGLAAAARVRVPTLLLLGGRDIMAPPKTAQALIGALADVRVVMLPECGHSMTSEQPDAVLDALRGFL